MAIAYENGWGVTTGTGTAVSLASVAPTGANRILIVQINTNGTISAGPTFGGVAMTQLGTAVNTGDGNQFLYVYYLKNPSTSSGAITATLGSSQFWAILAAAYSGVDQTTPFANEIDNSGAGNGGYTPGTPLSRTLTSDLNGSWALIIAKQDSGGTSFSAGSTTTERVHGTTNTIMDGNAGVNSGSTHTLNINWTGGGQRIGWLAAMIRPVAAAAPTLDTAAATAIDTILATLNGEITDIGTATPDERGFVWGTTTQSLPGNVAPASTAYDDYETEAGSFSAGVFDFDLTGLTPSTTYYVRAYAHNSVGYAYGDEISFNTDDPPPFRFENIEGVVYDPEDTQTIFAERLNDILERLEALEA